MESKTIFSFRIKMSMTKFKNKATFQDIWIPKLVYLRKAVRKAYKQARGQLVR